MTIGHLDIIKRARAHYDKVSVAVLINESKNYLFTLEERTEIARLTLSDYPEIEVVADTGMLVDLFDKLGADVIVKGVRNELDRAYEEKMAAYNLEHNPRAKTVFLQAADDFEDISSTRVRALLKNGESLEGLIAPAAIPYVQACKEKK
jgi:pantetheine-phosphate adenylyltransferase